MVNERSAVRYGGGSVWQRDAASDALVGAYGWSGD